ARFGENAVKPLRQRSSFQPDSLEAIDGVRQNLQQSFRLTRHPRFPHDLARIIHNADARLLDRHIQSSKIVHAALLLLMLEAADAALVHPPPRSPAPKFPANHKLAAQFPHLLAAKPDNSQRLADNRDFMRTPPSPRECRITPTPLFDCAQRSNRSQ